MREKSRFCHEGKDHGSTVREKFVVLGIGNRLMGDDGIGNDLVRALKNRGAFPELRLEEGETDINFCLDILDEVERVILIDATYTGKSLGTISAYQMDNAFYQDLPDIDFQHNFSLLQAMKTYGCEKEGLLIGVEAASVTYRLGLSEEIKEKFPRILESVEGIISEYINNL